MGANNQKILHIVSIQEMFGIAGAGVEVRSLLQFSAQGRGGGGGRYVSCLQMICVAGHFSVFCAPKMSSISGGSDSGKGKTSAKPGKGQGGGKAQYATQISPAAVGLNACAESFGAMYMLCVVGLKNDFQPNVCRIGQQNPPQKYGLGDLPA